MRSTTTTWLSAIGKTLSRVSSCLTVVSHQKCFSLFMFSFVFTLDSIWHALRASCVPLLDYLNVASILPLLLLQGLK